MEKNINSRPLTIIYVEKLDKLHTQIRAVNSLTEQLRSLTRNLTATQREIIERLNFILDKYERAIAPKPPAPTTEQVLAVFEQNRKLYDAWVASLPVSVEPISYSEWIMRELSKLDRGVKPVQELRDISKTGALDEFYQPLDDIDWIPQRHSMAQDIDRHTFQQAMDATDRPNQNSSDVSQDSGQGWFPGRTDRT